MPDIRHPALPGSTPCRRQTSVSARGVPTALHAARTASRHSNRTRPAAEAEIACRRNGQALHSP
eukprot:5038586-Prymnesium_polylepis.3